VDTDSDALRAIDAAHIRDLQGALVADLVSRGALTSPELRAAFERTPRHQFVPRTYLRTESGQRQLLDSANPHERQEWLDLVYTDDSLVTELGNDGRPSSSSTQPSLMARMLELLDVRDEQSVLEIGTGTGYNGAVLCERLGSHLVTTIDVEPHLVDVARERLRKAGYTPTVALADGASGWPPSAPYDRVLATCSVRRIPRAWIEQCRSGAVIVVNVMSGLEGGLVRLQVRGDGTAEGRYDPDPAAFIRLRGDHADEPSLRELVALVMRESGTARHATIPKGFDDDRFMFMAQFFLPSVKLFGSPGAASIGDAPCLVDLADHSWARVTMPDDSGTRQVIQAGEQRLWDTLERAHDLWCGLGQPGRERYGLTVRPDHSQVVWLDSPDSEHRWEL
jgi:methyltransferase of ATP-grasp peptide maturase system